MTAKWMVQSPPKLIKTRDRRKGERCIAADEPETGLETEAFQLSKTIVGQWPSKRFSPFVAEVRGFLGKRFEIVGDNFSPWTFTIAWLYLNAKWAALADTAIPQKLAQNQQFTFCVQQM